MGVLQIHCSFRLAQLQNLELPIGTRPSKRQKSRPLKRHLNQLFFGGAMAAIVILLEQCFLFLPQSFGDSFCETHMDSQTSDFVSHSKKIVLVGNSRDLYLYRTFHFQANRTGNCGGLVWLLFTTTAVFVRHLAQKKYNYCQYEGTVGFWSRLLQTLLQISHFTTQLFQYT